MPTTDIVLPQGRRADYSNTGTGIAVASYSLFGTTPAQVATDGTDLIGVNPLLSPLGNYGGPTETLPLAADSPAIGAGTAISGITTDQRGFSLDSPNPDIGAFQRQLLVSAGPLGQTAAANVSTVINLGTFTDRSPGPWTETVTWGDGSTSTYVLNATGSLSQTHTYATDNPDNVTVTLSDADNETVSLCAHGESPDGFHLGADRRRHVRLERSGELGQ